MAALLGLTILAKRISPVKRISNWYAMIIMIWTVLRSKLPVRLLSMLGISLAAEMLDVLIFDFDSDKPDSIPNALEVPFTIAGVCRDKWDLVRETIGRDNRQYAQARMSESSQLLVFVSDPLQLRISDSQASDISSE